MYHARILVDTNNTWIGTGEIRSNRIRDVKIFLHFAFNFTLTKLNVYVCPLSCSGDVITFVLESFPFEKKNICILCFFFDVS